MSARPLRPLYLGLLAAGGVERGEVLRRLLAGVRGRPVAREVAGA